MRAEFPFDRGDVVERGKAGLVAEVLDLEARGGAGEGEMFSPAPLRIGQVGIHIGAVEHVAGAAGVDHPLLWDRKRRQRLLLAAFVVPQHAALAARDRADAAAALLEIGERVLRRLAKLLAEPLGHHRHVDETQKLVCVRAQPAAVERREDAGLAAAPGVEQRGIGLMSVEMKRAQARHFEHRKRRQVLVVAAAHDGTLAIARHDAGQRRSLDLAGVQLDVVLRRHVEEHAAEPIVREGGDEIDLGGQVGAAERRGDRVAAERDGVIGGDVLLVPDRNVIHQERDVDVGVTDEKRVHHCSRIARPAAFMGAGGCPIPRSRPHSRGWYGPMRTKPFGRY
jgi:hypothetical protein